MSTSSDNKTPKMKGESAKPVITTDWNEFTAMLDVAPVEDFASWLDGELLKLESDLDQFVTSRSRYSGRR